MLPARPGAGIVAVQQSELTLLHPAVNRQSIVLDDVHGHLDEIEFTADLDHLAASKETFKFAPLNLCGFTGQACPDVVLRQLVGGLGILRVWGLRIGFGKVAHALSIQHVQDRLNNMPERKRSRRLGPDRSHYLNHRAAVDPFVTRDGSIITELMHPSSHAVERCSIAEAQVDPGQSTLLHRHPITEEVYHVLDGAGLMTLGHDQFAVVPGDIIRIAPGQPHKIQATSEAPLRFLCTCVPAYSDEDTEILHDAAV